MTEGVHPQTKARRSEWNVGLFHDGSQGVVHPLAHLQLALAKEKVSAQGRKPRSSLPFHPVQEQGIRQKKNGGTEEQSGGDGQDSR